MFDKKTFSNIINSWKEAKAILINGYLCDGFKAVCSIDDDGALENKSMIYYDANENFWISDQLGGLDFEFNKEDLLNADISENNVLTIKSRYKNEPITIQPLFERETISL